MKTLGVIAPYLEGLYSGAIASALYTRVRQIGASMLLLRTGSQSGSYDLDLAIERADAWICVVNAASSALLQRIQASGRPVCVIGHDFGAPELGCVRVDNHAGIWIAMQRLYDAGHRRFVFVGSAEMGDSVERREAARAFVRDHVECGYLPIEHTADFSSFSGGRDATINLLGRGEVFSVLIAASDQIARGAIALLRERGLRVPEDVMVVGFDNSTVSRTSDDGITSLDQNLDTMAGLAFEDVYMRSQNPERLPVHCKFSPTLIERESTGCTEAAHEPQWIERGEAQDFLVASEEVSLVSIAGRDAYLSNYLKRLEFRLRFARVARLVESERLLNVLLAKPENDNVTGARVPITLFPPVLSLEDNNKAGDFVAMVMQDGLAQGSEVIALGFHGRDLGSTLAFETLVHEMELLCYQLHVQMMSDELQRTLDSLRATQDELLRFEKHASLGVAIAGIAHELNTPLGNSLLATSTLKESAAHVRRIYDEGQFRRADFQNFLSGVEIAGQILERNVGSALRLVEDFKDLRGEQAAGGAERISLATFLLDMLSVLRVRCRKTGVIIQCSVDGEIELETHPQLLSQVLSELVENALTHGLTDRSGGSIQIHAYSLNDKIIIAVSDNGKGLASDEFERVFDPFYTSKMGVSSGLGLTMVHNLLSGPLAGKVWAEQAGNGGARFLIELPSPQEMYSHKLKPS